MPNPSTRLRRALAVAILVIVTACRGGQSGEGTENVRPPRAGVPAGAADVQGIYRTIHQSLLQLRGDGSVVLVVPGGGGPSSGRFTLAGGRMRLETTSCGSSTGTYDVVVTGPQEPGKAALRFTPVTDDCADRRQVLARDPWVYANS